MDLVESAEIPRGCRFTRGDVRDLCVGYDDFRFKKWFYLDGAFSAELGMFDFICASSPCEEFSVHGMKHFHPNPKYPEMGISLFNHTRAICEKSGVPHIMENVRAAQQFVGQAVHHCGPFYLWGNAIPPILPQGILKGRRLETGGYRTQKGTNLKEAASIVATIPPELANCVAEYAERIKATQEGVSR